MWLALATRSLRVERAEQDKQDKQALRADFERYAELPNLVRVIVAHEKVASGAQARASLLEAAGYL